MSARLLGIMLTVVVQIYRKGSSFCFKSLGLGGIAVFKCIGCWHQVFGSVTGRYLWNKFASNVLFLPAFGRMELREKGRNLNTDEEMARFVSGYKVYTS